jgi:hypothetical protein
MQCDRLEKYRHMHSQFAACSVDRDDVHPNRVCEDLW